MKLLASIALVLAVFLGSYIGILTGGGFLHGIIGKVLLLVMGVPTLIITVISMLDRAKPLKFSLGYVMPVAILCFVVSFHVSGKAIFHHRELDVQEFVGDALPLLDAYKTEKGYYPAELKKVADRNLPYYLEGSHGYTSDGESFTFYYETPDSLMGGLMLTDSHRTWSVAD